MKRILVIRAGALGDVILTFPALQELRRRYPDARIDVVGYPAFWEAAGELVDRVESIDHPRFSGLFGGQPDDDLRAWLEGVDLAIAWTTHDPSASLRAAGVPEVMHASPYPPPGVHAARWLVEMLGSPPPRSADLRVRDAPQRVISAPASAETHGGPKGYGHGLSILGASWHAGTRSDRLRSIADAEVRATDGGDVRARNTEGAETEVRAASPVYLHPGAGAAWKRWPAVRFAAVAQEVRERGFPVMLVEGPADGDAVRAVQESAGPLPVLRGLAVRELARQLAQGGLFVGNDSGVTHLAAWLGLPTIALFGPTDPSSWAPLGTVRVLRACTARATRQGEIRVCGAPACMAGLSVAAVLEAVLAASGDV